MQLPPSWLACCLFGKLWVGHPHWGLVRGWEDWARSLWCQCLSALLYPVQGVNSPGKYRAPGCRDIWRCAYLGQYFLACSSSSFLTNLEWMVNQACLPRSSPQFLLYLLIHVSDKDGFEGHWSAFSLGNGRNIIWSDLLPFA